VNEPLARYLSLAIVTRHPSLLLVSHDHENVAVTRDRTPQPGNAVNLHAMPCGGNTEPNQPALAGGKAMPSRS
jgi:hypothetical protein